MTQTLTIDPHVHSLGSYDAAVPVPKLLERARAVGLDGIVVTDHDTIDQSLHAAELAADYGLVGIPGVEVSTADGHLLAIGVTDRPEPRRPLADTVAAVRDAGGVAVVPHPGQRSRHGVPKRKIADIDAVEVYNAFTMTGIRNHRARQFAQARAFPMVGGSDAHSVPMVGRAYTELAVETDAASTVDVSTEAVLAAFRDGRTRVAGHRVPLRSYVTKFAKNAEIKTTTMLAAGVRNFL